MCLYKSKSCLINKGDERSENREPGFIGMQNSQDMNIKNKIQRKKQKKKEKKIVGAIFYERKKTVGYIIFTVTCYPQKR